MSTVQDIEKKVSELTPKDLSKFREWFEKFDAKVWDEQIEDDVAAGKLDKVAESAIADFKAGRCSEL